MASKTAAQGESIILGTCMMLVSLGISLIAHKVIVTLGTVTANRTECRYQITDKRQVNWENISCVWKKKFQIPNLDHVL